MSASLAQPGEHRRLPFAALPRAVSADGGRGSAAGGVTRLQRACAVTAAYTCTALVVTPFDRLKTLLQANTAARQSAVSVLRTQLRQGGLRSGVYRGLGYELAMAPFAVLYFSLYEEGVAQWRRKVPQHIAPACAAVVARGTEVCLRAPLDLLKTRAQAAGGAPVAAAGGGLYRGFGLLAARDLGFSLVYWSAYEPLRHRAAAASASPLTAGFAAGAAAGCCAAVITTPLDVVKTIRQAGEDAPAARIVRSLWRERGMGGLFAGLGPRLLRLPLGLATFMAVFETAKTQAAGASWELLTD